MKMTIDSLPDLMIEPFVRDALNEDLGRGGDITSAALVPVDQVWKGVLAAREDGVIAGLDAARLAFLLYDKDVHFKTKHRDGDRVMAGEKIAHIEGRARSILASERTALNFLSHLSGVATATRRLVEAVRPYKAKICCTRKTTPNLRLLEKQAVRAGGGVNHRMGLDDAFLIKDNHIVICGGIEKAVMTARKSASHMRQIEVEVDTLDQLQAIMGLPALDLHIDAVLLDNMDPATLAKAVTMVGGRFVTEASGRVTLDRVAAIAATGVDLISVGWITHSAPILDFGLDSV